MSSVRPLGWCRGCHSPARMTRVTASRIAATVSRVSSVKHRDHWPTAVRTPHVRDARKPPRGIDVRVDAPFHARRNRKVEHVATTGFARGRRRFDVGKPLGGIPRAPVGAQAVRVRIGRFGHVIVCLRDVRSRLRARRRRRTIGGPPPCENGGRPPPRGVATTASSVGDPRSDRRRIRRIPGSRILATS